MWLLITVNGAFRLQINNVAILFCTRKILVALVAEHDHRTLWSAVQFLMQLLFFSCLWLLLSLTLTHIRKQRNSSLLTAEGCFRTKLREHNSAKKQLTDFLSLHVRNGSITHFYWYEVIWKVVADAIFFFNVTLVKDHFFQTNSLWARIKSQQHAVTTGNWTRGSGTAGGGGTKKHVIYTNYQ